MTIRVLLVDDQEMIRVGLRSIIATHDEIDVVAEAGDGLTAVSIIERGGVDVALMDINMPGINGVETTRRIRQLPAAVQPRILVLTTFDQDENVLAALRVGADGFFSKGAGPRELTDGIVAVVAGAHPLSPTAIEALIGHASEVAPLPADPDKVALFAELTPREFEVVELIVDGLDNAEIGRAIYISPYTVKTHANRAMMKVGARDRAQLVSLAVQAGIGSTRNR